MAVRPRAELVPVPNHPRGLHLEVRPVGAADRVAYVAQLAFPDGDDENPSYDFKRLWPLMVIPALWKPEFDERGRWVPFRSNERVFHYGDEELLLRLPGSFIERLFVLACDLSGLSQRESKLARWRMIEDPQFRMLFELAWKWGCPVAEVCRRVPSYELTWWAAYFEQRNVEQDLEMAKASSRGSGASSAQGFG